MRWKIISPRTPRRIKPRRKQIDIVCSRGRRSRPPALPFLVRSNSWRAAAPRALGELCPRRDRQQLARRGRGSSRPPWACYALRGLGLIFPGPLDLERVSLEPWPGPCSLGDLRPPWPAPAAPPLDRGRGRLCRGRRSRRGSGPPAAATGPRDFPPRIGAGFSPVTRAAGDSHAHNARPRRFPA